MPTSRSIRFITVPSVLCTQIMYYCYEVCCSPAYTNPSVVWFPGVAFSHGHEIVEVGTVVRQEESGEVDPSHLKKGPSRPTNERHVARLGNPIGNIHMRLEKVWRVSNVTSTSKVCIKAGSWDTVLRHYNGVICARHEALCKKFGLGFGIWQTSRRPDCVQCSKRVERSSFFQANCVVLNAQL